MGVKLDMIKPDGRIVALDIGEGFLERDKFNEIVGVIKDLDERSFDMVTKKWRAPLTKDNVSTLKLILKEEEVKELEDQLEE